MFNFVWVSYGAFILAAITKGQIEVTSQILICRTIVNVGSYKGYGMFTITNTTHAIEVDKRQLYLKPLKTTYYLLHVSILIGSSSGRSVPY